MVYNKISHPILPISRCGTLNQNGLDGMTKDKVPPAPCPFYFTLFLSFIFLDHFGKFVNKPVTPHFKAFLITAFSLIV